MLATVKVRDPSASFTLFWANVGGTEQCNVRWEPFSKCLRCNSKRGDCVPIPFLAWKDYADLARTRDEGYEVTDAERDDLKKTLNAASRDPRSQARTPNVGSQKRDQKEASASSHTTSAIRKPSAKPTPVKAGSSASASHSTKELKRTAAVPGTSVKRPAVAAPPPTGRTSAGFTNATHYISVDDDDVVAPVSVTATPTAPVTPTAPAPRPNPPAAVSSTPAVPVVTPVPASFYTDMAAAARALTQVSVRLAVAVDPF